MFWGPDTIKVLILTGTGIFLIILGIALFGDGLLEAAGQATLSWLSQKNYSIRNMLLTVWIISGIIWIGFGVHLAKEWGIASF